MNVQFAVTHNFAYMIFTPISSRWRWDVVAITQLYILFNGASDGRALLTSL